MKKFFSTQNIIPLGKFKINLSKYVNRIKESDETLIITQNGEAAAVVISPQEYDRLLYKSQFVESVKRGLKDAEEDRVISTEALLQKLKERRSGK